ncbi:hypothetical protein AAG906_001460 [Vitis piasezkii]
MMVAYLLPIVTSVGSTGEALHVFSTLRAQISIFVVSKLDLGLIHVLKWMKILKYITEDEELRCIPAIISTIRAQVFSRLLGIVDSEVWQESWGYEGIAILRHNSTHQECFLFGNFLIK